LEARAIDAAARGEDQTLNSIKVRALRENLGRGVVQIDRLFGIEVARRIANNRRQPNDAFDVAHRSADVAKIADISGDNLEAWVSANRRQAGVPVRKVVEHANVVVPIEQHSR